jgi:hypothetical protein
MVKQYLKLLSSSVIILQQEAKKGRGILSACLLLFFMMGINTSSGQSLLVDDFSGTVGTNLTANGWVAHSGGGTGPMTIASPGLSYSGYLSSGVGNATSPSGNSEDVNKAFTSTNSGSLYCSFMVSTGTTVNTTDYCLHFCQTSGASAANFFARFFIQKDASNNVRFGISKGTEAAVNTPYSYALNTTYLIVIKYNFVAGATNDGVVMFVNPVPGGTEPVSPDLTTVTTGTDATALTAIAIRQFATTTLARFDGIRVGTTWAAVTPSSVSITGAATASPFTTTYGTASSSQSFAVSGSGLTNDLVATAPTGFEVSRNDVVAYGGTAAYTAAEANAGGHAFLIRLKDNAIVTGSYNSQNIVLSSSGGANSVNIVTSATGNTVSPIVLTITGIAIADKTFDNNTSATITGSPSLVGVLTADLPNVNLGGTPIATFNDASVGNGKLVSVVGYTISGPASTNYTLTQPSLTGNIISSGLQNQTITFGALSAVTYGVAPFALTATSDSNLAVSYSSSDLNVATISGSTITIVGAGLVTITASQAGDSNYNPATPVPQNLFINTKELTVSGATAADKVYDADTTTSITGGTLVGVINSDDVNFSGTGNFDDVNVGNDKPVTGNLFLTGTDAGNYFLTQPVLSADITPKPLTITGISIANKEYDTTTSASIQGTAVLFGLEFADAFSVSLGGSPVANFNDASVANNKPVTVLGYTVSGSTNYTLTQPTGLTANITLKTITIIGLTANNKEYDRTLAATLSGTASLSGILAGDEPNVSLSGTPSANFLTVTVGNGKTVSVTGYSLSGTALANYTLGALNLSANITKKDVTISGASVADKAYDGTTTATLSGTLSGVISPDSVTLNKIAAFADANVGVNKPVTSTSTITGTDALNYNLVQPTGLTAAITAIPCTQGASGSVIWDFGTSSANAAPASNTVSGVTISNISTGNNLGTVAIPINTTSPSSGYTGASGQFNIGTAARTGALNTGASGSAYFEFTLTPTGGPVTLTNISFGSRSTGTAPIAYTLRSSADGYATDLATGALSATSAYTPESSAVSGGAISAAVTYRLFGYNGAGSPGSGTINWRIDDLNLTIAAPPSSALSSASTANACSGSIFSYTPTTTYSGATITWTRAAVVGVSNAAVTIPQSGNISETLVNTTNAPVVVVYSFKVTGSTCFVTQDVNVTVNPLPIVTADDVSGCSGTPIALSGSGTPAGGSGNFSVANPYVGTSSTTYTYTYTALNGCSNTSAPANITITAQPLWYLDADNDHYYTGAGVPSCTSPGAGYTTSGILGGSDCNDGDNTIYPGAAEICYNNILENCSGTLSQGCAPVVVNMTPSYNNTTLPSLSTAIPAVAYSYAPYTNLKYRFSIKNTTTNATAPDIIQTSRYVTIPASIHSYNAQYTIKVSAVINEEVVAFAGNTITINSPSVQLITLNTATCGATLTSLASTLTANAGLNATGYTFRIRLNDANPTPTYATSQSATRFVSANSFTGFPLQYATSYKVAVQYTFNDPVTNLPVDSGYGAECTINTPSIPLTNMASPTCSSTVAALNANISAAAAPYATGYQFRIRLFADNGPTPTYYYTAINPSRFSSLTAFQGITLAYSTAYSISVQYSILNGSTTVLSGYGADCKVTTPSFPVTSLVPSQCGLATATSLTQQLNITPYPGFPHYKVLLEEVDGEDVVNFQEREITYSYFKLSEFSIAQLGKNYQVSVAIKLNGVFGNYDTACDLHTPLSAKMVAVVPFKATAYPNPFANNFMLDVKTASQSAINLKVYDMLGRLIEQKDVGVSDMEATTIGNQYPTGVYNVVVSQEDSVQTVRVVKR